MINVVLSILLFMVLKAVFLGVFAHGWSRRKLLLLDGKRSGPYNTHWHSWSRRDRPFANGKP